MGSRRIRTPIFRASYVNLLEPKEGDNGRLTYGIVMIFEPEVVEDPDFQAMQAAAQEVLTEKFHGNPPRYYRKPFRRGEWKTDENANGFDLDKHPYYEGKIIVSANAQTKRRADGSLDPNEKPGLCGPNPKLPFDPDKDPIYSGMYARATVSAFWYKTDESQGISFGLHNVQKCYDGEPIGRVNVAPDKDFEEFIPPAMAGNHGDLLGVGDDLGI